MRAERERVGQLRLYVAARRRATRASSPTSPTAIPRRCTTCCSSASAISTSTSPPCSTAAGTRSRAPIGRRRAPTSLERAPLVVRGARPGRSDGVLRRRRSLLDRGRGAARERRHADRGAALSPGSRSTTRLALEVRRQSGSEVAYVTLAPELRVVASTVAEDQELMHAIAERMRAAPRANLSAPQRLELGGAPLGDGSPPRLAGRRRRRTARTGRSRRVGDAGVDRRVRWPRSAASSSGADPGRATVFDRGVRGIVNALSRRITEPIERLARAVESAREGRFPRGRGDGAAATRSRGSARRSRDCSASCAISARWRTTCRRSSRSIPDAATTPPTGESLVPNGEVFANRFEILGWIGAGAWAWSHRARDRELNRRRGVSRRCAASRRST